MQIVAKNTYFSKQALEKNLAMASAEGVLPESLEVKAYGEKLLRHASFLIMTSQDIQNECMAYAAFYNNDPTHNKAYLSFLYVFPAYRGQGLAKVLLRELIKSLKEANFKIFELEVAQDNLKAMNLYKSLGFIQCLETSKSTAIMQLHI